MFRLKSIPLLSTAAVGLIALWGLLGLMTSIPAQAAVSIVYVDASSTAFSPDGSSWTQAYPSLQDGLAAAGGPADGDIVEIWVADGIYYPDEGGGEVDNDVTASFVMTGNVQLYGGFAGGETDRDDRAWQTNLTVLSGDITQNDTTFNGVVTDTANIVGPNSRNVVWAYDTNRDTLLDGFIVTGGKENPSGAGGGIRAWNSGSFSNVPGIIVRQVLLIGNDGGSRGGGIDIVGKIIFEESQVLANRARNGGGIFAVGGTIQNAQVRGNDAPGGSLGGGIYAAGSQLMNVVVTGNRADLGGGIFTQDYNALTNLTISGNTALDAGGGLYNASTDTLIQNTIIWNNADSSGTGTAGSSITQDTVFISNADSTARYSIVQGSNGSGGSWDSSLGTDGGNNLDADPEFISEASPTNAPTEAGLYELDLGSPAADAGDNSADINGTFVGSTLVSQGLFDIKGEARIDNGVVDLGAFEIVRSFWSSTEVIVKEGDPGKMVTLTLKSAPTATVTISLSALNAQCQVSPSSLQFASGETVQSVVISAVSDTPGDGDRGCKVTAGPAVSNDATFSDYKPADINVIALDRVQRVFVPLVVR